MARDRSPDPGGDSFLTHGSKTMREPEKSKHNCNDWNTSATCSGFPVSQRFLGEGISLIEKIFIGYGAV